MITFLWIVFTMCAVLLPYFIGIEVGREKAARLIETNDWFTSADPAAARYAAEIARGTDGEV